MSVVLITGGSGFLGSWVARTLLQEGHEVVVLDVDESMLIRDIRDKLVFQKGSIADKGFMDEIIKKHRPDTVFHFAALLSSAAEQNPETGYEVNIAPTWPLFESARRYDVKNILFASSMAVYGSATSKTVSENVYTDTSTLYGISKVFGELVGVWFNRRYGIGFAAMRYASIIGPGRRDGGASAYTSLLVQKAAQGEPYSVPVTKDAAIPLIYVKDAVDATLFVWKRIKGLRDRILNVAGPQPSPTAFEIVDAVKKHLPEANISFSPQKSYTDIVGSWPRELDTSRIVALGWRPNYANLGKIVEDFITEIRMNKSIFWI